MVRIKERYLLVNIIYPAAGEKYGKTNVPNFVAQHQPTIEKLTPQALLKGIKAEVGLMFGDYGLGALEGNLSVKYLSLATSTFILRCGRAHYQMLWSALTLMNHVPVQDGRSCMFRVVRVSGTIRKAEEEAIRQARRLILAAKYGDETAMGFLSAEKPSSDHDDDDIMRDVVDDAGTYSNGDTDNDDD